MSSGPRARDPKKDPSSDPAAPSAGDLLLGTAGAVRRGSARSSPTGSVAAWTLAAVDRVAEVFASRALRDPRDPSSPPSMRETCACVALALAHLDALEEDLDGALIEEEEDSGGGEGKADGAAVNDADAEDEEGSSATRALARASRSSNVLASRFASREGVREAVRGAVDAATERYLAGDLGGSSGEWLDASGAYVESGGGLEELRALCRAGIVDDDDE